MGAEQLSTPDLVAHARVTDVPRYALPGPCPRLRRVTTAAVAATVVLLLSLLAVTAHVLTTPAHKPVVPRLISSHPAVPSSTSLPVIGWLSVVAVAVLLILLVEKQRVVGIPGGRAKKLSRALNIAILPLIGALAFNVLVEVAASVSHS